MKVLDTTFLIDMLRRNPDTLKVLKSKDVFLTTQINMYEILNGLFYKQISSKKMSEVSSLFENLRLLSLDENGIVKAADICAELMRKGQIIDDCDCLIAGILLSKGVDTIVTRNAKHFSRIEGLKVETY